MKRVAATSRQRVPGGGAWWLLVAAWLCFNSPQIALVAVFDWCAQATHFSHQKRLASDVQALLATPSGNVAVMATTEKDDQPAPRALPPMETVVKKLNLPGAVASVKPPIGRTKISPPTRSEARAEMWRDAPPHEPPRWTAIV